MMQLLVVMVVPLFFVVLQLSLQNKRNLLAEILQISTIMGAGYEI